jgi:hypothetical protein
MLVVNIGEDAAEFSRRTGPELEALKTELGQIVTSLHSVRITSPGWDYLVMKTRFSNVEFSANRVRSVQVSPQAEYVTFREAAEIVDRIEAAFRGFGFLPRPDRTVSGDELRSQEASIEAGESYNDEVYRARRANVGAWLVLKKSVRRDSPRGQLAKARSDLYLLTLGVKQLREGDRF